MSTTANLFNVESSLNAWLTSWANALTPTATFGSFASTRMVTDSPEVSLKPPCYSAHHKMIDLTEVAQGRHTYDANNSKGMRYIAFLDISTWVSRSRDNWLYQQRWLASQLNDLLISTKQVQISDYLTNPSSPTSTQERVLLIRAEARDVLEDQNPDIKRERFLIRYETILRS